jgi:hypothetical protein
METIVPVDPVEQLLREYTNKMRDVIRNQLAADVTAAVVKAFAGDSDPAVAAGPAVNVRRIRSDSVLPVTPSQVSRSPRKVKKALLGDNPQQLQALLKKHRGNIAAVAKELDNFPVQIRRWLKKYSIDPNAFRRDPDATTAAQVGAKKNHAGTDRKVEAKNDAASMIATAANGTKARASRTVRKGKRKGGMRDPDIFAQQKFNVLAHLTANPGQRSEKIAGATKISTSDLRLVLKRLVADKKLKAAGVARGTTYTIVK